MKQPAASRLWCGCSRFSFLKFNEGSRIKSVNIPADREIVWQFGNAGIGQIEVSADCEVVGQLGDATPAQIKVVPYCEIVRQLLEHAQLFAQARRTPE